MMKDSKRCPQGGVAAAVAANGDGKGTDDRRSSSQTLRCDCGWEWGMSVCRRGTPGWRPYRG